MVAPTLKKVKYLGLQSGDDAGGSSSAAQSKKDGKRVAESSCAPAKTVKPESLQKTAPAKRSRSDVGAKGVGKGALKKRRKVMTLATATSPAEIEEVVVLEEDKGDEEAGQEQAIQEQAAQKQAATEQVDGGSVVPQEAAVPKPSPFDIHFEYQSNGVHIGEDTAKCVELLKCLKGQGYRRQTDNAFLDRIGYLTWAEEHVRSSEFGLEVLEEFQAKGYKVSEETIKKVKADLVGLKKKFAPLDVDEPTPQDFLPLSNSGLPQVSVPDQGNDQDEVASEDAGEGVQGQTKNVSPERSNPEEATDPVTQDALAPLTHEPST